MTQDRPDIFTRSGIWACRLAIPLAWVVALLGVWHFRATLDTAVSGLQGLTGTEKAIGALRAKFWFAIVALLLGALASHGLLAVMHRYLAGGGGGPGSRAPSGTTDASHASSRSTMPG